MTNPDNKKIVRTEPGYRELEQRLKDYAEVENKLSAEEVMEQATRCMSCGTPFCHGYACPLINIVPEINEFIVNGHWKEALDLLLSTHPFPEFTARICPALCEGSCVLGINDQAVSIRQIEKMIVETGFAKGWIQPRPPQKRCSERVAVLGSGPAGLATADRLNRKGYRVTVFEKNLHPGGIMMYGIPNFKLDKEIVKRRIKLMEEEGIAFECGIDAGSDVSFNYLKRHFEVLVLTGGSEQPRDLNVEGREFEGIHFAMELLRAQNKRILGEELAKEEDIHTGGKKVVVIGGGDTGSDCLGTVLRQGAAEVTQIEIMPRQPKERGEENPWPLWPLIDRVSSSHLEGGNRHWCIDTKKVEGDSDGKVKRLHCCEVEWMEREGRMTPVRKEGSDFTIEADLVFLALGFVGPGANPLAEELELESDERGNIKVDSHHITSMPGVFSAGDIARGQSLVVRAMADGIAAAEDIDQYLSAKKLEAG